MVRVPGLVALLPGNKIAPELLPVPTVAAPAIVPLPPSSPSLTCTGPAPVPERPVLLTIRCPWFFNRGASGVGVRVSESQFALANFGKRSTSNVVQAAILDHPGKGGAQFVAANGQVLSSQKTQCRYLQWIRM